MYKRIYDSDEIVVDYYNDGKPMIRVSCFDEDGRWTGEHFVELPETVVHAHWDSQNRCSNCCVPAISHYLDEEVEAIYHTRRCPHCGAHMDETPELRTCYCPLCDKHFEIPSNDSMGNCPECGHHVVLHREEDGNA